MSTTSLEKKIVAGLVAGGIASAEIAEMLAETESAITKADAAADTAMTTIECATTATVVARCRMASVDGVARLIDLFESAKAVDEEVSRINGSALPGEHRCLLGVELAARGLSPAPFDRRSSAEWGLVQEEGRAMRE